jgi:beta-lactamase superfamily II metal-dependent hydrolase
MTPSSRIPGWRRAALLLALMGMACSSGGGDGPKGQGGAGAGTGGAAGAGSGGRSGTEGGSGSGGQAGSAGAPAATGGAGGAAPGSGGASPAPDAPIGDEAGAGGTGGGPGGGGGALDIYFIDAEGGAATILHAPSGEVMVIDSGFPGGRDAGRVVAVLKNQIKTTKIDYLLLTHWHDDHTGGVDTIARQVPVTEFLDHGDGGGLPGNYRAAFAGKKRRIIKPGDVIQLGTVKLTFVSSDRQLLKQPLPGASSEPNPHCVGASNKSFNDENGASVGFVASHGKFDFVDLGDLLWLQENDLACPLNVLGKVELYQVTHHGQAESGAPQLVHAMAPVVAVMNNGASKGGAGATFGILGRSPGLKDLWQLHTARGGGDSQATEERIANPGGGGDQGHWLRATASADGTFTLFNSRNQHTKPYQGH